MFFSKRRAQKARLAELARQADESLGILGAQDTFVKRVTDAVKERKRVDPYGRDLQLSYRKRRA